jgi:transposase
LENQGQLLMSQTDRDRLVALRKAKDRKITQRQAAEELELSERQVRRLLAKVRGEGDRAVVHGLRGRPSNRKIGEEKRQEVMVILKQEVYRGFGPTLACEYLDKKHRIGVSKETVRKWMQEAGLWRARRQRVDDIHQWRARRERWGELVQWDTSEHDWLEGRGEKIYLIKMIDDASSRLFARFVRHDSTLENMEVLEQYLRRYGRPLEFYTDKASIFLTTPKKNHLPRDEELPPTQIGRALKELGVGWIAAHSPQAKGRVERSFQTAQDRLVKGLRVAGAKTLEQANAYLELEYLREWNERFTVVPACRDDAHRRLGKEHELEAILCPVHTRVVASDYTIRHETKTFQIVAEQIRPRMRGAVVRVESRRNGGLAARFEGRYLRLKACNPAPKLAKTGKRMALKKATRPAGKSPWMAKFFERPGPTLNQAIGISNATG